MLQSAAILLLLLWIGLLLVFNYGFIFLALHSKQMRLWSMAVSILVSLQLYCRMPSSTPLIPVSAVSASCWQQKYSSTAGLIQNSIFHHLQLPAGVQDVARWLLSLSNSIHQYLSLAPSAEAIFASAKSGNVFRCRHLVMSSLSYFDEVAWACSNEAFTRVEVGSQATDPTRDAATAALTPSLTIHCIGCCFSFTLGAVVTPVPYWLNHCLYFKVKYAWKTSQSFENILITFQQS